MRIIHKCDRCGFEAVGVARSRNEADYRAELIYNEHECKNPDGSPMRSTKNLPLHILRELAYGRITEDEAFRMADKEQ